MAVPRDPGQAREFALDVVRRLRSAGYQALWAGGCVRDQLLGHQPKDYDVATTARPEQVREVFGRRRTLAVGQAFGVICVRGSPDAGQIDVATFRCDAAYSDGRHPDHVTFSSAKEDAQRRDFTINGLFYDPVADEVIDYVGGREDLARQRIRAIGDPHERFAEDKLRMLRAVRFAAAFGFQIEAATMQAIRQRAGELVIVSAERIAAELRRMLVHDQRRRALELLRDSGLLGVILPEVPCAGADEIPSADATGLSRPLAILQNLQQPSFSVAFAALVRELVVDGGKEGLQVLQTICERLRLSNQERREIQFFLTHEHTVRSARQMPWPRLQRILVQPESADLLVYADAAARVLDGDTAEIEVCRQWLAVPRSQLDPPPLISGDDLRHAGLPPGPRYARVLDAVRDAQLEGRVRTAKQALWLAGELFAASAEDRQQTD